ncbi:MAG: sugar phosphate isomerase/epimerase, partial [Pseudomonadota bacterium]
MRNCFEAVMEACQALGFTQLFMPSVPPEERDSDGAYWLAMGRELGQFSHQARQYGIALGYHNHNWELRQKEGGNTALELLFDGAADSPLTWQSDVAWLVRGGADPFALLQRYRERVVSVHVKDLAVAGEKLDEDGWADVGS